MLNRRRFMHAAAGAAALAALGPARAETRRLTVMTSYPQEMISRYVDAFTRAYPGTAVDVVWHSGRDARDYLLGEGKDRIDVYWSPNVPTFIELAAKRQFRKLDVDRTGLPAFIGKQRISDADDYYLASEIAGYGLILNPAYLKRANLSAPKEWADLADPVYSGHIVMPVPSAIGFAPTVTEIILQSQGWAAGWSLLSRIAGNAELRAGRGDTFFTAVSEGEKGIGITIDFFASQAIARGAPLDFVYPHANAFEPANIAIPVGAPAPDAARDFVTFVLSDAGQKLLIDPDLRRLAIRPTAYAGRPAGYFDPWTSSFAEGLSFDSELFARRRDLDNALFDALIYKPRERLAPLWAAQRKAPSPKLAGLLGTTPIDEATAGQLAPVFTARQRDTEAAAKASEAEAGWTAHVAANLEAAEALLK